MTSIYSIIIPLYNKERQIARTLDSVLAQSVADFEVIVVDDGSKDGSAEIVKGYSDPRIRYIKKENGGVSSARNRGIQEARGEWILFLDGDDRLMQDALSAFEAMRKKYPDCLMFVGGQRNIREKYTEKKEVVRITNSPFFPLWLNRFWPCPGDTMIHKSLTEKFGMFDERISFFEDIDFFLRMMQCGTLVYSNKVVLQYNQEEGGLSLSKHSEKKEMAYYLPEMKIKGFFHKAVRYENLEFEINWWRDNLEVLSYYKNIKHKCFSPIHAILHWIRQKMLNHHWI